MRNPHQLSELEYFGLITKNAATTADTDMDVGLVASIKTETRSFKGKVWMSEQLHAMLFEHYLPVLRLMPLKAEELDMLRHFLFGPAFPRGCPVKVGELLLMVVVTIIAQLLLLHLLPLATQRFPWSGPCYRSPLHSTIHSVVDEQCQA